MKPSAPAASSAADPPGLRVIAPGKGTTGTHSVHYVLCQLGFSSQLLIRAYWPAGLEPRASGSSGSTSATALFYERLAEVKRETLEKLARHAAEHPECVPHLRSGVMQVT